jgi:hypothetical protein
MWLAIASACVRRHEDQRAGVQSAPRVAAAAVASVVAPSRSARAATIPSPGPPLPASALEGRYGFDWLKPASAQCTELVGPLLASLEGALCTQRKPGESFGVDRGPWHSCKLGRSEWMIFPTPAVCEEMRETMKANAP